MDYIISTKKSKIKIMYLELKFFIFGALLLATLLIFKQVLIGLIAAAVTYVFFSEFEESRSLYLITFQFLKWGFTKKIRLKEPKYIIITEGSE